MDRGELAPKASPAGLQRERTMIAWSRTYAGLVVCLCLLIREYVEISSLSGLASMLALVAGTSLLMAAMFVPVAVRRNMLAKKLSCAMPFWGLAMLSVLTTLYSALAIYEILHDHF